MPLSLRIDVADVTRAAARLTAFSGVRLRETAARAANRGARDGMATLRKHVGARVALSPAFIEHRTALVLADAQKPTQEAVLIAPARRASAAALGLENPLVSLRNYGPQQLVQGVRYPNASIAKLIGKWGRNPTKPGSYLRWKARRGDLSRGIAVDSKADGVGVHVLRGAHKRIATAFLAPARAGKRGIQAGGMAVFQRQANGSLKLLHGPAVYRLFHGAAARSAPQLREILRAATEAEVATLLQGSL